ncbi:MAG: 6-carboxytetrahydropterin synthase [Bacteroidota bacterium]
MIYITRKEHFNAAHKLYNPHWSNEENLKAFGKCANPNFHGHNYEIYVTIKGKIDPETGFVMNLFDLSDILKKEVVEKLDHKNLNLEIDYFQQTLPSIENLCIFVWNILEPKIKAHGAQLHCIKIQETDNNYAEYYGE